MTPCCTATITRTSSSNAVMTETRLDVLLLSQHLVCPKSKFFGKPVKAFYASRIHKEFGGKFWQVRTLMKDGTPHILPFIINTGGCAFNHPIVANAVLERLGVIRGSTYEPPKHGLVFPTPLSDKFDVTKNSWDTTHEKNIQPGDLRYNLVGQELAGIIVACDELIGDVLNKIRKGKSKEFADEFLEDAIDDKATRYREFGATKELLRREVDSMLRDVADDGHILPWTSDSLPIPKSLWVE